MTISVDEDLVVLVDSEDIAVGTAGKLEAHRRGLKHRAISALVRNSSGEFLLQRRSPEKYHSGGLWTNACCSHPLPGESTSDAAHRRLRQEMGISCLLTPMFIVHYRAPVSGNLIENELVHVFGGTYDGAVVPDPAEVSEWKWVTFDKLEADLCDRPDAYTVWFRRYIGEHHAPIAAWLKSAG
jgi:isopentenyl-diphosphate delta-isomerase